jgi:hypothetical protein
MNTQVASEARHEVRRSARATAVLALGPVTIVAALVWAALQPYRITLLDPHGQGLWWLLSEPPLYVAAVGLFFHLVVAPGVVADLEEAEE